MLRHLIPLLALPLLHAQTVPNRAAEKNPADKKYEDTGKPLPAEDPALKAWLIDEKSAALPPSAEPIVIQLPLQLKGGEHIVFIGNTLFERAADHPVFEAMIQAAHPGKKLVIRTLAWSADEVDLAPRPENFGTLNQHLFAQKADVIFAAYGFNESFRGPAFVGNFQQRLRAMLKELKSKAYNGRSAAQIVLVSPIANEDTGAIHATQNNAALATYTQAISEVAQQEQVGFIDAYAPTLRAMADESSITSNGIHLDASGYELLADVLYRGSFGASPPELPAGLVDTLRDKNQQFFRRYRPLNTFYYTGDRNKDYGYLDFLPAMQAFEVMVSNREQRAWNLAQGKDLPLDDSNVPTMPASKESKGVNEWLSPEAELASFQVDPRFEVNLWASEVQFPDLAKPISMRWDGRGRLWVSTSVTYPHVYPGKEGQDRILILADDNTDGIADSCTTWAEKLQVPLSFALGDGGVYCSEQPNLIFLKDSNHDGKADRKDVLLSGFGTEDSHHALHDFAWSPDGALIFRESIFHHSQIETPYGPVRARESSFFRFIPQTQRLQTFGGYSSTNPWGICFDEWGNHLGSHPVFVEAVYARNAAYPDIHVPAGSYIPAYSGTCGQAFLHNAHWGPEYRGHFARVRYKPTNEIELHQWVLKDSHYEEKQVGRILLSTNLSFIPVDCQMGPDGALYVCDWYNPVKGHAQYSLRDERRDRKSGRIWRITRKGAKPLTRDYVSGRGDIGLTDMLASDDDALRALARRELNLIGETVDFEQLTAGLAQLPEAEVLERLWAGSSIDPNYSEGLQLLLASKKPEIRAAAVRHLRDHHSYIKDYPQILLAAANDTSGLVRLQAAVAASWIGTSQALDSALSVLKHPMDDYLKLALRMSLDSASLKPLWHNNAAFMKAHPELAQFLIDSEPKKPAYFAKRPKRSTHPFDQQPGVAFITIGCVKERMMFDKTEFTVTAGQPTSLQFINPDATPHNFVLCTPGSAEEIGIAGNEMAKLADGLAKHFVPTSPKILHHTPLVNPNAEAQLRFTAPKEPGDYPYICTFPGHWVIMRGVMKVTP
jgi:azurin/glucose/arabinose dehydrogenase